MVFRMIRHLHAIAYTLLVWSLVIPGTPALGKQMTLVTANGDRVVGEWLSAADTNVIIWQAKDFAGPFEFLPDSLAAVYGSQTANEDDDSAKRDVCICELVTGDILCGMPVSFDAETLKFRYGITKSDSAGEAADDSNIVSIPRDFIRRLTGSTRPDELIVDFPGTANAMLTNVSRAWSLHGGKLVADTNDAKCFLRLPDLPSRIMMSADLSWEANTDFAVSLMPQTKEVAKPKRPVRRRVNQQNKVATLDYRGLRLERWGDRVVLSAQSGEEGDLLLVADDLKGSAAGKLRLQICLDAKKRMASAYRDGQFVGKLSLPFPLQAVAIDEKPGGEDRVIGELKVDPDVELAEVRQLQRDLEAAGYPVRGIDGMFGARTLAATKSFQSDQMILLRERIRSLPEGKERLEQQIEALKDEMSREVAGVQTQRRLKSLLGKPGWQQLTEIVKFESYEGELSVERLRISTWNGRGLFASQGDEATLVRMANGDDLSGSVVAWDAKANEFTFKASRPKEEEKVEEEKEEEGKVEEGKGDDEEAEEEGSDKTTSLQRIALTDMVEIIFNNPSLPDREVTGEATVLTNTGSQVTGEYAGTKDGRLHLQCSRWKQHVSFPVESIASVVFGGRASNSSDKTGVTGVMRLEDSEIKGQLVTAKADDLATCLAWHPVSARNAQSLLPASNGTIAYREIAAADKEKVSRQRELKRGAVAGFFRKLALEVAQTDGDKPDKQLTNPPPTENLMTLELRSGDSIPFQPKRIDEGGVTFESPLSDVTFVSHAQVKAISLRTEITPAELTKVKRERLLTVPRRYKDRPPTHLLLSVNKDILRGRLISMDNEFVTIEMRMTPRRIPRDRVAAILWLDEVVESNDEAGDSEDADTVSQDVSEPPAVRPGGFHVLATKRGGQRITILPDHCEANVLYGTNPVLEECKLDLAEVDELAFGSDIEKVVQALEANQIVLISAAQPRFMSDDGEAGPNGSGQDSALVGKPAPPIQLKRLNGEEYDLAEEKEKRKVIVLDFWATWCGPCIQWMPRAEAIVDEFANESVELVAVNLSETEDVITPVLKRLELDPTVLLDVDGVVADAYKATAIPQTVVIDRNGNVARVFIGGGKQNETLMRDSLKTLTGAE